MPNDEPLTRAQIESQLADRAWRDNRFYERLVADPKKIVNETFGITLPENVTVEVLEEGPRNFYIVLPARYVDELTDEDLAAVNGAGIKDEMPVSCPGSNGAG